MNIRTEIEKDGFLLYPFPRALSEAMKAHIVSMVKSVPNLTDEQFVEKFAKHFRMFPDSVAHLVHDWVASLAPFFHAKRTSVNYVNLEERTKNPSLRTDSYDIFWRCVRPGKPDMGAAHCDFQFWELAKGTSAEAGVPFESDERWKLWIPLIGCDSTNSLQVVPGSHREEVPIDTVMTKNGYRPVIQPHWMEANEKNFICPFTSFTDQCILFHDKLVHRGPPNNTSHLRLSGELTILLI